MSGEWSPARPFWRNGEGRRLGPTRDEPVLRAFSPTVDRLPGDARSVVVPAILALVTALVAIVAFSIGIVGISAALSDAAVFEDVDNVGADRNELQLNRCQDRREQLEQSRERYARSTGEQPDDISDLDVGATDFILGRDGRPVPAPGSVCEGVVGDSASTADAIADRVDAALVQISEGTGLLFLVVAFALFFAAGGLSWWLAEAYRCLPKVVRHRSPRRAYTLLRTIAVSGALAYVTLRAIAEYVATEDVILWLALMLVIVIAFIVLVARAVLRLADMIGNVTFEFCNRHYGTARAMRVCTLLWCVLPPLILVLDAAIVGTRNVDIVPVVLVVLVIAAVTAWLVIIPLVFVVCLFIAVWLGTSGIERALTAAAHEINVADAEGRSLPSTHEKPALV